MNEQWEAWHDPSGILRGGALAVDNFRRAGRDAAAVARALAEIVNEVQAVNSVFVSASLPVSVNNQGTFLNQVYMGMFRPDGSGNPLTKHAAFLNVPCPTCGKPSRRALIAEETRAFMAGQREARLAPTIRTLRARGSGRWSMSTATTRSRWRRGRERWWPSSAC